VGGNASADWAFQIENDALEVCLIENLLAQGVLMGQGVRLPVIKGISSNR
jgi:hypothetical protein